ncbi:DUF742 domain-containing protein [Haloechinothrix sp. LS1_15]|uniref:DUF742 domain-containing protein n=1 Tax=Haloechinothrix sp. LS1_15 TaxID=2652248 RepID=UPI0029462198|nr:DUF742 domain-containing protein [Haloechinothrix sp. LS1_15]MDV6014374.1 DUF742 domain-containing protein [Haloechinothrix sp. LS1_15]
MPADERPDDAEPAVASVSSAEVAEGDDAPITPGGEPGDATGNREVEPEQGETADVAVDDAEDGEAPAAGPTAEERNEQVPAAEPEPEDQKRKGAPEVADQPSEDAAERAYQDPEGDPEADDEQSSAAEPAGDGTEAIEPAEAAAPAEPTEAGADATATAVVEYGEDPGESELDTGDAGSWVRPYVWTGGRTGSTVEFALETLVSARTDAAVADPDSMREEHRRVLELCEQPRSVTEIAALLAVPLGVAKTLVGSMAEDGMVTVHHQDASAMSGPNLELMERVLRGLRNL